MTVSTASLADLRSESVCSLYDQLMARCKDISHINGISGILHWDQEMSVLVGLLYDLQTSPIFGTLLDELEYRKTTEDFSVILNPYELANIRLSLRTYNEQTLVPAEIAKASAATTSKSVVAWTAARKESEFA
ncbi:hypothetical protein BGX24_011320, partial [Mortierella sp. AD032]